MICFPPFSGLCQASVHLLCLDFGMSAVGDLKTTPCEARNSAATRMLYQLHLKANEKLADLGSSTPDAAPEGASK